MALPNSRRQTSGQSLPPVRSHISRPTKPMATPLTLATPTTQPARATATTSVSPKTRVTRVTHSPRNQVTPSVQKGPLNNTSTPPIIKTDAKTSSRYDVLRRKYDAKRDVERPSRPENRKASASTFFITETDVLPSNEVTASSCANNIPLPTPSRHRDLVISSDPLLSFTPTARKSNTRLICLDTPPVPTPRAFATPLSVTPLGRESPTLQSIAKPDPSDRATYVPPISLGRRPQLPLQKQQKQQQQQQQQQHDLPPVPQRRLPYPRHLTPRNTRNTSPRTNNPPKATRVACTTATLNCLIPLPSLSVPVARKPDTATKVPTVNTVTTPTAAPLPPSASTIAQPSNNASETRVPVLPIDSLLSTTTNTGLHYTISLNTYLYFQYLYSILIKISILDLILVLISPN